MNLYNHHECYIFYVFPRKRHYRKLRGSDAKFRPTKANGLSDGRSEFFWSGQIHVNNSTKWTNCLYGMPLLPQLFIHSRLMVDLIVESQKDFEQRLGVSVEQFMKVARSGLVVP